MTGDEQRSGDFEDAREREDDARQGRADAEAERADIEREAERGGDVDPEPAVLPDETDQERTGVIPPPDGA